MSGPSTTQADGSLFQPGNKPSDATGWVLIERWCEHYPDDWRLLFKRDETTLEVSVPESVWRAFDTRILV
jgi:hypothetical protein